MAESVIASMESTALWPQNTEWHASFCSCDLITHHCRPPTLTMRTKADVQAPPEITLAALHVVLDVDPVELEIHFFARAERVRGRP